MITESYCSFKVAKLLKEKGFGDYMNHYIMRNNGDGTADILNTCTHQMACAWLREKGVYIEIGIVITTDDKVYYHANVGTITNAWKLVDEWNDSYENSVENALKYTLENLI